MPKKQSIFSKITNWVKKIQGRILRNSFIRFLMRVMGEMNEHDGTNMAAGVAFYAFLSLFPLLLGLIGLLGLFLPSQSVQDQILNFMQSNIPGAQDIISNNIHNIIQLRGTLGAIAIIGLLWSGSGILSAGGHAINRAWNIPKELQFYLKKPRDIGLTIGLGILFFLSLSASAVITIVQIGSIPIVGKFFVQLLLFLIAFALAFVIFLILFKVIPNTQTYWRHIWPGALFTAILFEIGRFVFFYYITNFGHYQAIYGAIGSVIAVLLWIYYSAILVILGAELTSEYSRLRRGIGKGRHSHSIAKA